MKIIIITGKSGSGKTYVATKLAKFLNAKHINLDEISHKTLETETLKSFVLNEFGTSVFDENKINRKKLGALAFLDTNKLNKLNALSEQIMNDIIDEEIQNCKNEFVVLDYLLLPKMKYLSLANIKILVKSNDSTRKSRVISRDNISEDYFLSRESHSIEFNETEYDFILNNEQNIDFETLVSKIKAGN